MDDEPRPRLAINLPTEGGPLVDEDRSQAVRRRQSGTSEARGAPPMTSRSQFGPAFSDITICVPAPSSPVRANQLAREEAARQLGVAHGMGPAHGQAGIGGKVLTPSVLLYADASEPDFWALQSQEFR